jgi:hypothetical protein
LLPEPPAPPLPTLVVRPVSMGSIGWAAVVELRRR